MQVTLSIWVYGTTKLLFSFIDCFGLTIKYEEQIRPWNALAVQSGDGHAHHLAWVLLCVTCAAGRGVGKRDVQGTKDTRSFRKRLVQKCYRAGSAIGSGMMVLTGLSGEHCCVGTVPLLRRYHHGQGFWFLPEMQRLGFPSHMHVETGHSSTDYLYDMQSYHTDACAHMHTKKKKTSMWYTKIWTWW